MSSDDRSDFDKDAYEHAWRMFDKHATQRIQCLNFYIVVLGGLSAAAGAALSSSFPEIALGIVTFLSLLFVEVFRRLEARNKELVKISEQPLHKFEAALTEKSGVNVNFLETADSRSSESGISYSSAFQLLIFLGWGVSLVLLALTLCFIIK